jgi:DNA-binding NarL/FixJ family response regulator
MAGLKPIEERFGKLLTPLELLTLRLFLMGFSDQEIASRRRESLRTIAVRIVGICNALGFGGKSCRTQLAIYCLAENYHGHQSEG